MKIISAEFVKSCTEIKDCPIGLPEYAFIGRSNVGKSSLINMITERKSLAKTSSTPGKTQTINYFCINFIWHIVDLPGYGYAKTSKTNKASFGKMIDNYILRSSNLMTVFVLIDSRIPPQNNDLVFINNLGENEIPFVLIMTKIDKVTKNICNQNIEKLKKELLKTWESLPQIILSSAEKKIGQADILNYINETNKLYKK